MMSDDGSQEISVQFQGQLIDTTRKLIRKNKQALVSMMYTHPLSEVSFCGCVPCCLVRVVTLLFCSSASVVDRETLSFLMLVRRLNDRFWGRVQVSRIKVGSKKFLVCKVSSASKHMARMESLERDMTIVKKVRNVLSVSSLHRTASSPVAVTPFHPLGALLERKYCLKPLHCE